MRTFVYFITYENGPIKIGKANNIKARMATLQTSHPYKLEVLGLLIGDPRLEKALHTKFSHLRMNGEWFRKETELLDWIAENTISSEADVWKLQKKRDELEALKKSYYEKVRLVKNAAEEFETELVDDLAYSMLRMTRLIKSIESVIDYRSEHDPFLNSIRGSLWKEIRGIYESNLNCDWRSAERLMNKHEYAIKDFYPFAKNWLKEMGIRFEPVKW